MIKLSLFEKLKHFFQIIINNDNILLITLVLLIVTFFVLLSCKMKGRMIKVFYTIMYITIIGSLIYIFHEQLLTLIDYLIENIIANLLFPNLAIYMGMLLIINIIVLITIFSNRVRYYIKSINIICFAITQLFLYLIIDNVIANDVNVYEKLSIYTNQNLLVLVELSMQFFVVWFMLLEIIRLIDYLMEKSLIKSKSKVVLENKIGNYQYALDDMNNSLILEVDYNNDYHHVTEDKTNNVSINTIDYSDFEPIKNKKENYLTNEYEFVEYVPIKKLKKSV